MIRITAATVAVLLFSMPAVAQEKGRSGTAPGHADTAPGQAKPPGESAKGLAPGKNNLPPPGAAQRETPIPGKAVGKNK